MKLRNLFLYACFLAATIQAQTPPVMETGGQAMPDEWIELTNERYNVNSEIVCPATKEVFYQNGDTVFALNVNSMSRRIVTIMPEHLRESSPVFTNRPSFADVLS